MYSFTFQGTSPGLEPQQLGKDFSNLITGKEESKRDKRCGKKQPQKDSHGTDHLSSTTSLMVSLISRPREVRTWLADSREAEPSGNPVVGHEACQSLLLAGRTSVLCSPG